jgi:hypothetical protein
MQTNTLEERIKQLKAEQMNQVKTAENVSMLNKMLMLGAFAIMATHTGEENFEKARPYVTAIIVVCFGLAAFMNYLNIQSKGTTEQLENLQREQAKPAAASSSSDANASAQQAAPSGVGTNVSSFPPVDEQQHAADTSATVEPKKSR